MNTQYIQVTRRITPRRRHPLYAGDSPDNVRHWADCSFTTVEKADQGKSQARADTEQFAGWAFEPAQAAPRQAPEREFLPQMPTLEIPLCF